MHVSSEYLILRYPLSCTYFVFFDWHDRRKRSIRRQDNNSQDLDICPRRCIDRVNEIIDSALSICKYVNQLHENGLKYLQSAICKKKEFVTKGHVTGPAVRCLSDLAPR